MIKVINPNTTWTMTEKIGECAGSVAGVDTEIRAVTRRWARRRSRVTTTRRLPCPAF